MKTWEGQAKVKISGENLKLGVIVSRFNHFVTDSLLSGALDTLKRHGVLEEHIEVVKIPGCFEMPVTAKKMIRRGCFDALVCLGAIIRGETSHYDLVSKACARGLGCLSQEFEIPIGFGVVTAENMEQALNRAGGKSGNKGSEAALAALEMASLFQEFKKVQ
ncbi:MAG: 6,7-dimethyl-8-ribityllumazine synthase [Deltaproteobacteria bacterium]|nr:6,7-dimethyl-8-ribityllumazine synthase [Deltaproteobacteria bacterium]